MHSVTEGQTDKRTDRRRYDDKSRSYCEQYDRLKWYFWRKFPLFRWSSLSTYFRLYCLFWPPFVRGFITFTSHEIFSIVSRSTPAGVVLQRYASIRSGVRHSPNEFIVVCQRSVIARFTFNDQEWHNCRPWPCIQSPGSADNAEKRRTVVVLSKCKYVASAGVASFAGTKI